MHALALAWLACSTAPSPPDPSPAEPRRERPKRARDHLERTIVHQGEVERNVWVHVPEGGGAGKPVVVVLGGGRTGDGRRMVQLFDQWFDKGVVLAFPNARNGGDDDAPAWEGVGGPGGGSMADVDFLKALADQVVREHGADRERVFVAGYDSGGFETWQLACFAADVFKGFAVVSSSLPRQLEGCGAAGFPRPLLVIGGTDDARSRWDGDAETLPVFTATETFARKNGCELGTRTEELLEDLAVDDGTRVKRHSWTCTGAPVQVLEIAGGGHPWPRKDGNEKACRDIEAADEVMSFFGLTAP